MLKAMNRSFLHRAAAVVAALGLLTGCDPNRVFEENTDFANYSWDVQQKPAFTFAVSDTAARYDIYFNVRHAAGYGFYNLYVKHTLTGPAGPVGPSQLHQLVLMDPKTGEPKGSGSGDIYDLQLLAMPKLRFARPGSYTLTLEQYMRIEQLPNLMAVGVRVAKHEDSKK